MLDPNTAIKAAGEGANAIGKLGEIVQKLFGPKWTKKQADADAYADEKKLQTIRDNPDMEIIYANGQINARLRTPEALAYRAEQRQLSEAIRQEANIEGVLDAAAKEIGSEENVSDQSVDDDWLTRFFSIVKDISAEDMQYVWGKILAGEVQKPGSFSLRTLEVVRNLSRQEAEAFQTIVPLILTHGSNCFIYRDAVMHRKYECSFSHILTADECGLVKADGFLFVPFDVSDTCPYVLNNGEYSIIIQTIFSEPTSVELNVIPSQKRIEPHVGE